jgi:hypothetical protein
MMIVVHLKCQLLELEEVVSGERKVHICHSADAENALTESANRISLRRPEFQEIKSHPLTQWDFFLSGVGSL